MSKKKKQSALETAGKIVGGTINTVYVIACILLSIAGIIAVGVIVALAVRFGTMIWGG